MEGQEIIDMVKTKYKPKVGYSLLIHWNGTYCYSIFKTKELADKKEGTIDIASLAFECGRFTRNKEEFKQIIEQYCEKL